MFALFLSFSASAEDYWVDNEYKGFSASTPEGVCQLLAADNCANQTNPPVTFCDYSHTGDWTPTDKKCYGTYAIYDGTPSDVQVGTTSKRTCPPSTPYFYDGSCHLEPEATCEDEPSEILHVSKVASYDEFGNPTTHGFDYIHKNNCGFTFSHSTGDCKTIGSEVYCQGSYVNSGQPPTPEQSTAFDDGFELGWPAAPVSVVDHPTIQTTKTPINIETDTPEVGDITQSQTETQITDYPQETLITKDGTVSIIDMQSDYTVTKTVETTTIINPDGTETKTTVTSYEQTEVKQADITVDSDGSVSITSFTLPEKDGETTITEVTNPDGSTSSTSTSSGSGNDGSGVPVDPADEEEAEFSATPISESTINNLVKPIDDMIASISERPSNENDIKTHSIFNTNPFDGLGSVENTCQTIDLSFTLPFFNVSTTFPNSTQCEMMNDGKRILGWAFYVMALIYGINLVSRAPK